MAPIFTGSKFGFGSNTSVASPILTATGGTIIDSGGYRIHVFTSPGSFVVSDAGSGLVEYVVVAGGGGSSPTVIGGGAGAGGFRTGTNFPITATTYPITIGGGGVGSQGSPSIFSTITSAGGGAGPQGSGSPGGSGSGADYNNVNSFGLGNTPPTSPPQGNPGGTALGGSPFYAGGGGGGAGAAGNPGTAFPNPAKGGDGSPVTWIPASYGTPGPAPGRYFAGGGGGATYNSPNGPGPGGAGGGGFGGTYPSSPGSSGGTNTGGGAGGNVGAPNTLVGGSGIVLIRYLI
jgi:hypothetical protein